MPKFTLKSMVESLDGGPELARALITDKVRAAARKAGVLEEDLEDVVVITSRRFDLDDRGGLVMLGDDGRPSGVSADDFFGKSFREQRSRYYGPAAGGTSKQTIKRADFDKMDAASRASFFAEGGQLVE